MKFYCLTVVLFLFSLGFATKPAMAQYQCQNFLEQNSPQTFPISKSTQVLIEAAEWLSTNAHQIQPESTHLEPLIPYTIGMIEKVKLQLPSKSFEPLFEKHKNYVNQVLDEAMQRIAEKKLTYEYLFGLPIRLGFLLTMRETNSLGNSDPQSAFEAHRYADHNLFMQMFIEASKYHRPGFRPSSFKNYYTIYDSFPYYITIPTLGNINYRTINALISLNVWPIGITMKPVHVDGRGMDELMFAIHDLGHIKSLESMLDVKENIPLSIIRNVMRSVFLKMEKTPLSRLDFESLQFLYFIYFHESVGFNFRLLKDGVKFRQITTQSVIEGFIKHLTNVAADLIAQDAPGLLDIQQEFDKVLKGQSSRQDMLQRLIPIYQSFLEQAVSSITVDDSF